MPSSFRHYAAGAASVAMLLFLANLAAQSPERTAGTRTVVSEPGLPAIDRGVSPVVSRSRMATLDPLVRARGDARFVRGSVVVKFRPDTPESRRRALIERMDGSPTARLPYASFDILAIDEQADPEAIAAQLDAQPEVEYAQARYLVRPRFRPNDPFYNLQWNYPMLDMERAWDINPGATPTVVVAVLDSGVAYLNQTLQFDATETVPTECGVLPALGRVTVPFAAAPDLGPSDRFVSPRDFIWNDDSPMDFDGHGTHVAGTIGQLTNNGVGVAGMAFNVKIMPVKVIAGCWDDYFGSPFSGTDDVVARGIRYAVDNGAKVLNLSIGRTGPPAPVVQEAAAYAVSRGAFLVVSAGNEFLQGNQRERFAEFATQIDGMVSVGAVARDRARASYSNTGSYVELSAPGGDFSRGGAAGMILQQTYNFDFTDTWESNRFTAPRFDVFSYIYLQGTSMAAPHVAGLAALLMQQGITNPAAIEAVMKRYATDLGPPGRDDEYGYGLINPRASLRGMGLAR